MDNPVIKVLSIAIGAQIHSPSTRDDVIEAVGPCRPTGALAPNFTLFCWIARRGIHLGTAPFHLLLDMHKLELIMARRLAALSRQPFLTVLWHSGCRLCG